MSRRCRCLRDSVHESASLTPRFFLQDLVRVASGQSYDGVSRPSSGPSPATVRPEVLRTKDFGVKDMQLAITPFNTTMSRTPLPLAFANHQNLLYSIQNRRTEALDRGYRA